MTRDEVKEMLATMSATYPPNLLPPINELTVNIWHKLMEDLPGKLAMAAAASWMTTNKYPPTIADIRERCVQSTAPKMNSAEEAWSKVLKAIRSCGHTEPYRAERELGDLWQMVGRDWSYYCSLDESQTPNEKTRFIRMYSSEQKKAVERLQIPAFVQKALANHKLMQLTEGSEVPTSDD
jgi:hypothetical protein